MPKAAPDRLKTTLDFYCVVTDDTPGAYAKFKAAAEARAYVCPLHGQIGLAVDGFDKCLKKTGENAEFRCGELCERRGDFLRPELLEKLLKIDVQISSVVPVVMKELGLDKAQKVEQHAHFHNLPFTREELDAMDETSRAIVMRKQLALLPGKTGS